MLPRNHPDLIRIAFDDRAIAYCLFGIMHTTDHLYFEYGIRAAPAYFGLLYFHYPDESRNLIPKHFNVVLVSFTYQFSGLWLALKCM